MQTLTPDAPLPKPSFLPRTIAALVLSIGAAGVDADGAEAVTATAPEAAAGGEMIPTEPAAKKGSWVDNEFIEAFTKGKFDIDVRLRYENADQENLETSNAFTIRPRFGFTTAPLYGIQGMLQAENVTRIAGEYNPGGGLDPGSPLTVIADPATTEINQAWISYSNWDSLARVGLQRIVLDNQRFIGDVAWRQNQQTFEAVRAETDIVENASFLYTYIYRVNRIFGNESPVGDFASDSHVLHGTYDFCEAAKLTGYGYLLDFENAPRSSGATAGISLTGGMPVSDEVGLDYRAEFAWQTDMANNPNEFNALYYTLDVTATWKRWLANAGYEVLGSDNNVGFQTPLATLHKFNGWADAFLATPPEGLRDLWGQIGVNLPLDLPLRVVYHKFWAQSDGRDFGQEIDASLSRKFGKYFSALIKYAYYDGASGRPDIQRFTLQGTFRY